MEKCNITMEEVVNRGFTPMTFLDCCIEQGEDPKGSSDVNRIFAAKRGEWRIFYFDSFISRMVYHPNFCTGIPYEDDTSKYGRDIYSLEELDEVLKEDGKAQMKYVLNFLLERMRKQQEFLTNTQSHINNILSSL